MSTLRLLLDHAAGWLLLRVDTGQQDLDDVTFVCFCVCVCVCVVCVCVFVLVLCCVVLMCLFNKNSHMEVVT